MKTQANEARHLRLLIGGVASILLCASGIGVVIARMPTSTDMADVDFAPDDPATRSGRLVDTEPQMPIARSERGLPVRVKCAECGVVASTREIKQLGAAGGVTRDGRNGKPGKSTTSYEVTVRMRDGSRRVFMDANPATWRPGERMTLIEGASRSND